VEGFSILTSQWISGADLAVLEGAHPMLRGSAPPPPPKTSNLLPNRAPKGSVQGACSQVRSLKGAFLGSAQGASRERTLPGRSLSAPKQKKTLPNAP
jgi:hypothetical protein